VVVRVSNLCSRYGCLSEALRYNDASNPELLFRYNPPEVFSVTPNHGPTEGKTIITLYGSSFGETAEVTMLFQQTVNKTVNLPLTIISQTHTTITAAMVPAAGASLDFYVEVDGQNTTVVGAWGFDPPVITDVSELGNNGCVLALVGCAVVTVCCARALTPGGPHVLRAQVASQVMRGAAVHRALVCRAQGHAPY
jgi:hypothetical protein